MAAATAHRSDNDKISTETRNESLAPANQVVEQQNPRLFTYAGAFVPGELTRSAECPACGHLERSA